MPDDQAWQGFLRELEMERRAPKPQPVLRFEPIGETAAHQHRVVLARALKLPDGEADYERVVEPAPPRPNRKAAAAVRRYQAAVDDLDETAA